MIDAPPPLADPSPGAAVADPCLAVAVALIAWAEGVDAEALVHLKRGEAEIVEARHQAIYLAHVALGRDLSAIAAAFGRDRASVRHALRRIEDRRDDPGFDRRMSGFETILAPLRAGAPSARSA